ncbi:DUF4249 domain-containing protein [Reichenbachiella agariperforans]|uniref:DUF4249 domain-containing protein n=1 Tax=Reichenbachiella agariperforans TaxID=156994 RepID=A0A1M6NY89_REIAG|nr:DUF4249 domain-containing protein [Reichenbachiella agariperforans]MBU2916091.1 DUF4249 domain-containing protein [Reichenbachiella agariperforans]SHK00663.1 protein of unknown function [Reichenbachiella agariperforans]
MNHIIKYSLVLLALTWVSCDDQIYPTLEDKDPILVIDAFIDNKSSEQQITISKTQPYFDETRIVGVDDAIVQVSYGSPATTVTFTHTEDGVYTYPAGFGQVGDDFVLTVSGEGETFTATSRMNRVPVIDSVTFTYDTFSGFGEEEEFYLGEFWSTDPVGEGDTYWIKAYKNTEFLSQPSEINLAYDAAFGSGNGDGTPFIQPIRQAVNSFGDDDAEFESPYADGDSLYVEIYSISNEAFEYLQILISNTNIPGGFGALFAGPLSNTYGNIQNTDESSTEEALGFFSVSAVEANGKKLDVSQVPKEE